MEKCTSLRSLPKLPLNIGYINGYGCTSLEMVPNDLLESNSLVERRLYLSNCNNLANNQGFMDMFLAGIRKHIRGPLSIFHSVTVFFPSLRSKHKVVTTSYFSDDIVLYLPYIYDIIIPGSEIPEWFSHQSMGGFVEINERSHVGNELVGIAVCVVFCSRQGSLSYWLEANGKAMSSAPGIRTIDVLSDHTWLLYLQPQFYEEKERESLRECDENGFSQISISLFGGGVKKCGLLMVYKTDIEDIIQKKCGLRMVYKTNIEDLNQTMSQSSNVMEEGSDEFPLAVESELMDYGEELCT